MALSCAAVALRSAALRAGAGGLSDLSSAAYRLLRDGYLRPFGALINPITNQVGLCLGEGLPFVWHDIIVITRQCDPAIKLALVGLLWNDHHSILAPLERNFFRIEAQFPLLFLGSVAFNAGFLEDRLNILRKINLGLSFALPLPSNSAPAKIKFSLLIVFMAS